jgi:selenide,water dikinase
LKVLKSDNVPVVKDLVLVGGGHSHVTVLKRFGMKPLPGVRITLVCRDIDTPYSGMLPGLIAGHYEFRDTHIDLGPLSRFAGARFFHDEAVGLDFENKRVVCRDRPPIPYDILSLNIGSAPATIPASGAVGNVVPVKPIDQFVAHWQRMRERVLGRSEPTRIGVVGGGAGGVEMLLAIRHRLMTLLSEQGRSADHLEFHLLTDTDDILPSHSPRVRAKFRRVLETRGVHVHTEHNVVQVEPGVLHCDNGAEMPLDEVLWVTWASAASWVAESGLDVDDAGFIRVNDCLQSTSHADIFSAGDIAGMVQHPRPKAGVFAVRQGPPLARNLRRALLNRPLKPFAPQRQFLSLISTGDRYAIASRSNWALEGRWVWCWKNWIDQRFMRKFNDLPDMDDESETPLPSGMANQAVIKEISALAMRCGGCGAKVGSSILDRALGRLQPVAREDVLIGLHEPDDAAVVEVPPDKVMVHTVDAFRSFVDDPYVFGKIAANHSLSDIYAMGAEPQTALAIATLPYGLENKVEDTLSQMMEGAMEVFRDANTALVGGHTSEGSELSLGFAVNGLADRDRIMRKAGLQPGDRLILTKAIGTGTLFAADMRHKARGQWIADALESMVRSNREAAQCLREHGAGACTDITGFGLLGHLVEMIKPSRVDVEIDLSAIPLLDGALETVRAGIFSSLQPQNVRLRRTIRHLDSVSTDERYPLIFDPQTSGGLLACIPAERAESCVAALQLLNYPRAAIIGTVRPQSDALESVTLLTSLSG